ncbi:hypothetical protein HYH03_007565 [Edaphochlamys debaryana]|uniref:Ubiquitin-like domain-containing protein n=1 Tax=Edaphochlamys debaryana TaxID=47281 RepID=A0A835Y047_9CHLO|nr:hypothetical protein HYH03_007565 [Edaphochlamys debaryana]|eukprot:KAG2494207.1 hypothetical protein HYH03_007565 [Edaphochlamys debaryana]
MPQVKVRVLTPTPLAEAGSQVSVDLEAGTPLPLVKAALARCTGLAVERQRLMLGGIGDLCLLDKRSNIGASHCGSTNSLFFATLPSSEAPQERK